MEFTMPSFLKDKSPEEIFSEMMVFLPEDFDKSEGSITWDMTYPTAYVASEVAQFILPEAIKQIFPQFATGDYLDYHGECRNLARKLPQYGVGTLTILGEEGLVVPMGSVFSTVGKNETDPVEFETTEEACITDGSAEAPIRAQSPGAQGNVLKNTITIVVSDDLKGIASVTNQAGTRGGFDQETDESLAARILEFDNTANGSYIGNVADYRRWAQSVEGIGAVNVIPATDNSGLVTLVLIDSNGGPAPEPLCTAVYDYIMSPADPGKRLAPIGASLKTIPPATVSVTVTATVKTTSDGDIGAVTEAFLKALTEYFVTASKEGKVKYSEIGSILLSLEGLDDYKGLELNGGQANLAMNPGELPVIGPETALREGII